MGGRLTQLVVNEGFLEEETTHWDLEDERQLIGANVSGKKSNTCKGLGLRGKLLNLTMSLPD